MVISGLLMDIYRSYIFTLRILSDLRLDILPVCGMVTKFICAYYLFAAVYAEFRCALNYVYLTPSLILYIHITLCY